jgi:hypothetical protein
MFPLGIDSNDEGEHRAAKVQRTIVAAWKAAPISLQGR